MLSYQQLVIQLQSGERQLREFQQFRKEFEIAEVNIQILAEESSDSQYQETIKTLIKWIDWFLTETGYEEEVLHHNVEYINRRLETYPAIELEIERRSREIRERLLRQNNQENS